MIAGRPVWSDLCLGGADQGKAAKMGRPREGERGEGQMSK